jgi:hypothetical protein
LKALKAYVDFWVRLQNFSLFNFFKINLWDFSTLECLKNLLFLI